MYLTRLYHLPREFLFQNSEHSQDRHSENEKLEEILNRLKRLDNREQDQPNIDINCRFNPLRRDFI